MKIAIDFDGTCVAHAYPYVGKDIGAVPVLKNFVESGHLLILNTMRSGKELADAVNWFKENGIPLHGINEDPGQRKWTQSPKVFANIYIDDAALGAPLKMNPGISDKPFIDWAVIWYWATHMQGILNYSPNPIDPETMKEMGFTDKDIEDLR
jgi:hypothetical protein